MDNLPSASDEIITFLKDNPFELLYDPEDDECADSFELERFIVVKYKQDEADTDFSISYSEFDRRVIDHCLQNNLIKDMKDVFFLTKDDIKEAPFYVRAYTIGYN